MRERVQQETLWYRLGRIDYRYIYAVFIVALLLLTVTPIGFPVKVGELVQGFWND